MTDCVIVIVIVTDRCSPLTPLGMAELLEMGSDRTHANACCARVDYLVLGANWTVCRTERQHRIRTDLCMASADNSKVLRRHEQVSTFCE
jgi:hypothetical protein